MALTARAAEEAAQTKVDNANAELQKQRASGARTRAAAQSDLDGLRQQINAYANPVGSSPQGTFATDSGRAASLGRLLGDVLQDYASCTAAAEANADSVRALLKAWPGK